MNENMNVLFLGNFYPKKLIKTIKDDSFGKVGFSNHNFEMSIINGLTKQENISLRILTAPNVYSYPYNNKRVYTNSESYIQNKIPYKSIGFCNILVFNKISLFLNLVYSLIVEFKKFKGSEINVILNTPNFFRLLALLLAEKFSQKKIIKTLIVPDIPSLVTEMDHSNRLKSILLKYMNKWSIKMANKFDFFVLLTDAMKSFFKKDLNYIVMEGIIDVDEEQDDNGELPLNGSSNKNIILYTGTLRKIFGVMDLVEAFDDNLFKDSELWICGSGEAAKEIAIRSLKNPRIKFLGLVDSEKARRLQKEATILVNPRTSEGLFTKYSFPSKTMEYLKTGKAVVINKLPGIPPEYYKYVFTPQNESVEDLRKTLRYVLDMDPVQRFNKGLKGKQFIETKKNSRVQVCRILSMIRGC